MNMGFGNKLSGWTGDELFDCSFSKLLENLYVLVSNPDGYIWIGYANSPQEACCKVDCETWQGEHQYDDVGRPDLLRNSGCDGYFVILGRSEFLEFYDRQGLECRSLVSRSPIFMTLMRK